MTHAHAVPGQKLTDREHQILTRLANGRTISETAAELFLSLSTVRTYLRGAHVKLGARTHTHAVAIAIARGHLSLPTTGGAS